MITKAQKVKMLINGIVLFFAGGFMTGVYMYAEEELVQEDTCSEPCPECVPKVPLTNLEEE